MSHLLPTSVLQKASSCAAWARTWCSDKDIRDTPPHGRNVLVQIDTAHHDLYMDTAPSSRTVHNIHETERK